MIDIFKSKQNNLNELSDTQYNTIDKNIKTQNHFNIKEYKNIIFYPSSTKEWFSSIYSFNKSYIKSLISYDVVLNKLLRNYSNMLQDKIKISFKNRRDNKIRYSANKIYSSRAELEHFNTKLRIILYTYNKQKSFSRWILRKIFTLINFNIKFITRIRKPIIKPYYTNRAFYLLKDNFCVFSKWHIVFFKLINSLVRYLLVNLKKIYLKIYNISTYYIESLIKSFRLQNKLFNTTKLINFAYLKYNNLKIRSRNLGLICLIEKLYKKNIEIQLVELGHIHLNSDVFSGAVTLKLRDRGNKAVRVLRKAILQTVRIPNLHTFVTFDYYIEAINKNNIINTIKQQIVSGVRFEASGRLTRRLTAMRAIFKHRYVGSLKDIRTSFNNKASTMLRGFVKSNLQYIIDNSKTRNGAFGVKCWISSHNFILVQHIFWFFSKYYTLIINLIIIICVPYLLEISIVNYVSMIFLTIFSFITIVNYINNNYDFNSSVYIYLPSFIYIIPGILESVVDSIVKESIITDTFTCVFLFVGLNMLLLNLFLINKNKNGFLYNIKFIFKNIDLLIIIVLMFSLMNIILHFFGLGLIINTDNLILFIVSVFSKIVLFKLISVVIHFSITKRINIDLLSINIITIIFILTISYINIFIIFPIFKTSIYFCINKVNFEIKYINNIIVTLFANNKDNYLYLTKQFNRILNCNPILYKLSKLIFIGNTPIHLAVTSPFKIVYNNIIHVKHEYFNLVKLNKFLPFTINKPLMEQHIINMKVSCKLKDIINLIHDNSIRFKYGIIHLVNKYNNLDYTINLMCSDYNTNLSIQIRDGSIKEIGTNILNVKPSSTNSFYNVGDYARNELYDLKHNINPIKELTNYRVNMVEIENQSIINNIDDVFPENTLSVFASEEYRNLSNQEKINELEHLENEIFTYYMDRVRCIPWINEGKEFTIREICDDADTMKLIPERLYNTYLYKESIYSDNYRFDYRNSNLVIYSALQDLYGNTADTFIIRDKCRSYIEDGTLKSYVDKWSSLCGVNWLTEEDRDFPSFNDNSVYDQHHPNDEPDPLPEVFFDPDDLSNWE